MQQCCGGAECGHTPANARARRCEPRQVRRRRALLRSQPCRRHPTVRPTSSSAPAVPHQRRRRSRSDAALPAPRLPALRPVPCDRAVDPTTSRAMPLSPNVPGACRRDACRCAIAAADPPRPQACAGRGGGPRPAFFICGVSSALASFGACGLARAVRWLRHRPIAPPRTLQAPVAAMAAGLLARALRKLRPQPDTGCTQAPDTAQARGERAADAPKLRFRYRRRRQGLLVCAQQHIPLDAAKGRSVHGGPSPAAPAPAAPAEPGRA